MDADCFAVLDRAQPLPKLAMRVRLTVVIYKEPTSLLGAIARPQGDWPYRRQLIPGGG